MLIDTVTWLHQRLQNDEHSKILFFGSSNTARITAGVHWSDVLDLGLEETHGRIHRTFQMGVGGDTTQKLLDRIHRDAIDHQPDVIVITIGGNDSNPAWGITDDIFRNNLIEIHRHLAEVCDHIIFQTYYAPITEEFEPSWMATFSRYMQIIRDVAEETGAGLLDPLKPWEALKEKSPHIHRMLMRDGLHLNALGNAVFGLDLARQFGIQIKDEPFWNNAQIVLALLDAHHPQVIKSWTEFPKL
jgi:lysophospholipase L1-like esterase